MSDFEDQLVKKYSEGCGEAFAELHDRVAPLLLAMIVARVGDEAMARDISQDVWMTVVRKIDGYEKGNFRGWAWTIARNKINDFGRRQLRRGVHTAYSENMPAASRDDSPGWALQHAEETKIVRECLESLEDRDRQILVLKYFEAKSYQEISMLVEIEPGTVGSRLNRAKRR